MSDVVMPRLSDSMEEGTIIKWLKASGEEVRLGEAIAEIETDKATMAYEADAAGFLQIVATEGQSLAVGAVIAHLLGSAADASAPVEEEHAVVLAGAPASAPAPEAEPVASSTAAQLGVDLARVAGSGPDGRIVKADVMAAGNGAAARPTAVTAGDELGSKGAVEVIEPSRSQQLIARRMASAKATIPEFQVTVEVDAEAAFDLREQLRGQAEPLPSVNDLVIKACALALRAHPGLNAAYVDGRFERYGRVNVGVAVAGAGTLVVPTVFDADTKPLTEIAVATRTLAAKVRDGSVTPPELSGATFTVSNLGMLGVTRFTAVINPPQAAILAVGAANPRAVVGPDGSFTARRVMELTISADHRIVYGADAADFLATVRKRLERPAGLLL
jgi:pyruvate dehydrogenase E2 component (dihydrolipoamide acetyltransferase)